ncbi:type VI secretion system contractile sheath large subunit [Rhodobacter sp. KR11]|uniref:type VI secretion system contractile sheath domain-containing protein n=1 Tax=Rhodobacter sp. KR11 TaxID=2974588 RepID=UPI002222A89A|nr:type VI secretion system contractile sheath large subunit [Rhodobacter sp. KR11]MCW1917918.1 type VI secretion system contractile sheath large subunit [Rhodobacter sp. KR11]
MAGLGFSMNFGTMSAAPVGGPAPARFRIALMGDFSGRAAKGELETGAALAKRRPIKLDIDTVEKVIAGFATELVLPIGKKGAGIAVTLRGLDDLHPDELFGSIEMFEELVALKRRLATGSTAKGAVSELREWGREFGRKVNPPARKSAGNAVPSDRKLSDFARLSGRKTAQVKASATDELLARVVGPHIQALPDPNAAAMQEAVEESLAEAMRLVLHHPEFQSVEAQWRMLDLIARSVETDAKLDIVLYDISAEELAADLAAQDDLTESGFCQLLVESTPDGRGPFSAVCGLYTFEETPPHAELVARIAKVAAHVRAPFFAAITPTFLDTKPEDRHPMVAEAWDSLRAQPEAGYVGLVSPRFLLRRPYGAKSEPIYEFDFEEFTETEGLSGMLWANPVALVAILLAQSYRKNGPSLGLGKIMSLGGMPYHYVKDRHGDQVALPCTERNLTQAKTQATVARGYMPVISVKGRDEVRLGSFNALNGSPVLGFWADVPPFVAKEAASFAGTASVAGAAAAPVAEDSTDAASDEDTSLDDLLAGFGDDFGSSDDTSEAPPDSAGNDDEMDADLAALLASL